MCLLHMEGAAQGLREAQARYAQATWVAANQDHAGLCRFVDQILDAEPLPAEALPGLLRSAAAGLPVISMAEYLKSKGA
ncbi:hypothetical protein [uncultured Tateyamaria sp.]|uniref:hypothetical protein n=1 Tax=uncultured Tateyamaria sp. TaxID=455651 RepID=UPI002630EE75|nr:hypothetical protein [uncultured Tateyamaria sp.]